MKLGVKSDAGSHTSDHAEDDARVDLNRTLEKIKDEYYYNKDELSTADQRLFETSYEDKYGGKFDSIGDDVVPAILTFIDDEASKRIVGHLMWMLEKHWQYKAYNEY